jgi:hypothetical protein
MLMMFRECGWPAWLTLLLTMVALSFGFVAVLVAFSRSRAKTAIAVVALVVAAFPAAAGVFGTMFGRAKVDEVVSMGGIDPAMAERIRQVGYGVAGQCVSFGFGGSALPMLVAIAAITLALARARSDGSSEVR